MDKTISSLHNSNLKTFDENKFSAINSPFIETFETDVGLEEYNKCLKNALTEAIEENEMVKLIFYKKFN